MDNAVSEREEPHAVARPQFSPDTLGHALAEAYGIATDEIVPLGSFVDQNFRVREGEALWTVKVHDPREHLSVLEMQDAAIGWLVERGFGAQLPEVRRTLSGGQVHMLRDGQGRGFAMRVLRYIDGPLLNEAKTITSGFLRELGRTIGELDHLLLQFRHPAAARPAMVWDLMNAPSAEPLTVNITDHETRRLARYFLMRFDQLALPVLRQLPMSVVHNDCHRFSVVADNADLPARVTGIIDFGDTLLSHPISHLAVVLSDILVTQDDLIATAATVVSGYVEKRPISAEEAGILLALVGARLAIYAARSAHAAKHDEANAHAQLKTRDVAELMGRLIGVNPLAWEDAVCRAAGLSGVLADAADEVRLQQEKRDRHLPQSLYTHYQEPLSLVGSALQYFYDRSGKTYVDFVNNVSQSGHCHPTIVKAISAQAARLNTNSRYLYNGLGDYCERLAGTFPDPLNYVFLVNSGSEANDLALRLARAYTGGTDSIVIDTAYHGNSTACTEISPQRLTADGPGLPDGVQRIMVPNRYRGPYGYDDPEAGRKYGALVQDAIAAIEGKGRKVASFVAESMIGTGGQIVLPDSYLATVYDAVRKAGGITIADEVQMGFGRIGTHMWCWETQGVVPDIVTMGKPIANGHPMAAVVTRREIAAAFDKSIVYFNTFGGNPVSCAAANAVMDVLEGEDLRANVRDKAAMLMEGLSALQRTHAAIGDIRGLGLYIGVELVEDRETKVAAARLATEVVEKLKGAGFLVNSNGAFGNIIKIKPPLLISDRDIRAFLAAFDTALGYKRQPHN
jgi:4-aminobutyrate aminotransferase-like enzyme/Ser/Thr protein kinase RdoA (MazF antagonist)